MICRFVRFPPMRSPVDEWVPMGLQDAVCILRQSDPQRWTEELARHGIEVDLGNCLCLHNLTASWEDCPLSVERRSPERPPGRKHENEFGYPMII